LAKQTIASQLEVIVVHDGEDDEATAAIFEKNSQYPIPDTQYIRIAKSQQGIARNRGVERATAPIVLFLDDDIFLDPHACEVHLRVRQGLGIGVLGMGEEEKTHASRNPKSEVRIPNPQSPIPPIAVLGFLTWDPAVGITPVMRWLEKTGWELGYRRIERFAHAFLPPAIQHRFTYTGQLSIPRAIALAHPFTEAATVYGWEDILWGTKLREGGIRLFYAPDARGLHHQKMNMEDSLLRMRKIGRALREMREREPTFDRIPRGGKLLAYRLAALLPTMGGKHRKALLNGLLTARHPAPESFDDSLA